MTRIERLYAYRARRRAVATILAAVSTVIMAATIMAAATSSSADAPPAVPVEVADYNNGGRWPLDMPEICIEDHTRGFPVREAAAEFEGIVDMVVATDCSWSDYVVEVVLVLDHDMQHDGYFSETESVDGYRTRGLIEINTARAYEAPTPDSWRRLIIHELGHATGLEHVEHGESIMYPDERAHQFDGLTDLDRAQLAEVWQ